MVDLKTDEWRRVIEIHLTGSLEVCREEPKRMRARRGKPEDLIGITEFLRLAALGLRARPAHSDTRGPLGVAVDQGLPAAQPTRRRL